ncbi:MAG: porphobilinogen synthase [Pirellulales bacterium]|nr:porphobilinogen synthase [Pirellulales bacterium]
MPADFGYPVTRLRRLRQHPGLRDLTADVRLHPRNLVLPLFVRAGANLRQEIPPLPGHAQLSPDLIAEEARAAAQLGLGGVLLFGIPATKDAEGSSAWDAHGPVPTAIARIKEAAPDLPVITDLCCCEYTDHGHCGILKDTHGRWDMDNDATLELLARQAVCHARAGVDVIAPSGMVDGMVGVIRAALDSSGFSHIPILSYAVKYASAFYGPFRVAAESAPMLGDRRGYQMSPAAQPGQAVREAELDLREGADMLMVKPGLPYLDILALLSRHFPGVPLAAYHVSGEYSSVCAAARAGWLDERACALESLTALRRAGAGILITYWAKQAARWLAESTV